MVMHFRWIQNVTRSSIAHDDGHDDPLKMQLSEGKTTAIDCRACVWVEVGAEAGWGWSVMREGGGRWRGGRWCYRHACL